MSTFEQFLGGGSKIGEVIPMVSSEMPISFSAGGGTHLRSGYAASNSDGQFNEYLGLTHTETCLYTATGTVPNINLPVRKVGSNYVNGKHYTTNLAGTWTAATGGSITSAQVRNMFTVGTTVVCTSITATGMLDYSTDNGQTWTNVAGFAAGSFGVVNAAGTLCTIIHTGGGVTAGNIYTSTNGTVWTSRTPSVDVGNVRHVTWSPLLNAFLILGDNGLYSTTNGYTLTLLSTPANVFSITSSATALVAFSTAGSSYMRSTDGVTWGTLAYMIPSKTLFPINTYTTLPRPSYNDGKFIATGPNGVVFYSIDDGVTWERVFVSFTTDYSTSSSPVLGVVDSTLYVSNYTNIVTSTSLVPNGVMAKAKAEPTEGYAYVRIG